VGGASFEKFIFALKRKYPRADEKVKPLWTFEADGRPRGVRCR
jgi:hypothetical protein